MGKPLGLPNTEGLEIEDAKAELRKVIRHRRRSLSAKKLELFADDLVDTGLTAVGDASTVALYVSVGNEPSTVKLLDALYARNVRVLLPALGPGLMRQWAWYQGSQDLAERAPGRPPEPSGERLPAEAIMSADLVITPALAVDGLGNRLGQGGGWYDRMLKLLDPEVPVFAMVYDEELVSTLVLPTDEYDVTVHAIITPSQTYLLRGSRLESATRARVEGSEG